VKLDFVLEHISVLGISSRVHLVLIHTHRLPTHRRLSDCTPYVHAAVSSATGVTGIHFSCAIFAANRLAEGRGRQQDSGAGRLEGKARSAGRRVLYSKGGTLYSLRQK